jgi:hypothetical protein
MLVNLSYAMTVQIGSLINIWSENTALRFIFENTYVSVWVSNSEERKSILARIAESLYFGSSTPVSGSASAYARSRSVSYSMSRSESAISPIINLN